MTERLEELEELVALVALELLVHYVGILETMKNWDDIFIQDYMCWSKACSLMAFSLHLWHWLDLGISHSHVDLTAVKDAICRERPSTISLTSLVPEIDSPM